MIRFIFLSAKELKGKKKLQKRRQPERLSLHMDSVAEERRVLGMREHTHAADTERHTHIHTLHRHTHTPHAHTHPTGIQTCAPTLPRFSPEMDKTCKWVRGEG